MFVPYKAVNYGHSLPFDRSITCLGKKYSRNPCGIYSTGTTAYGRGAGRQLRTQSVLPVFSGFARQDRPWPLAVVVDLPYITLFEVYLTIGFLQLHQCLYEYCCNKGEDRIQFRNNGENHGIAENVESLTYRGDTAGAHFPLEDA